MDKTQIIIISALMAFLAVRLYQKYIKKDKNKTGHGPRPSSNQSFSSSSKDDDYEPYAKK